MFQHWWARCSDLKSQIKLPGEDTSDCEVGAVVPSASVLSKLCRRHNKKLNSGDRRGPFWHTSDTAVAQADGSWITEGTGAQQPEGEAALQRMCAGGKGGSPKHFTLHSLQVHVQIHKESLPVCERGEINSNAHLVKTSGIIGGGRLDIAE